MKLNYFFTFLSVCIILSMHQIVSASDQNLSRLNIHLSGFENSTGVARVAITNSKENYSSDQPYKGFSFPIIDNQVTQTIPLPKGEYAIKAFHDENGNDVLDKRSMGMPKERYGFSNNARGFLSMPDYEKAVFKLDSEEQTISITLK